MGLFDDFRGILSDYTPKLMPDDPDKNAAVRQGLLAAGAAMMSNKGDNFFGSLGHGLLAGQQVYNGTVQQQQKDQVESAQLQILRNKDRMAQDQNSILRAAFGLGQGQNQAPSDGASAFTAGTAAGSGAGGAQVGGYNTSYNGTPYSAMEAGAAARALMSAGAANFTPEQGNQVMSLARQGMTPEQAAQRVLAAGPSNGPAAATPADPASDDTQPLSSVPKMSTPGMRLPPPIDWSKVPMKGAQGPAAADRGAASFPLTLNQVAVMKAMGMPDLSAEYRMAHEGFKREQGSTYIMPDGSEQSYAKLDSGQVQGRDGTIRNAAGYVDAVSESEAAKARAQESAKADFDLLDPAKYIGADGRPIGGTRGQYILSVPELPRKQPGAPVTLPPVRGRAPAGFPTVSPQEQQGRDNDRLFILQSELDATTNPRDRAALQREIAGVQRSLGRGAGGAAPGGRVQLQSPIEARVQAGAVDTNLKAGQDLNSNWITAVHNPVQAEGKAARATLGQLATLQNIDFQSGWGAQTRAAASSILGALGIKDADKYATSAQKFQQVAMERNMTMLQAQTGPQTDGDSERAQKTFVTLSNTPAANQYIADLTAANARIAVRRADYYNKALPLARQRGDLTEVDRRWSAIAPSVWDDPALKKYGKVK